MLAPKLIQSPTLIIAARVFFLSCFSLQFSLFQCSDFIPASLALAMSSLLLCLSVLSSSRSIWMFCLSSTIKTFPHSWSCQFSDFFSAPRTYSKITLLRKNNKNDKTGYENDKQETFINGVTGQDSAIVLSAYVLAEDILNLARIWSPW